MRPVLLLVDLQNDFLDSEGLEPERTEVVRRAKRLLDGARALGVPVIHAITSVDSAGEDRMPHWKALGRRKCVRGTEGHAPPNGLEASNAEPVVSKTFFSAFSSPALEPALAKLRADTLVVAGVYSHGCVRATVLDGYQRGYAVRVAEDAIASDDPLHAAVTRRYLHGRAATFAPVEDVLAWITGETAPAMEVVPALPAAVVAGAEIRAGDSPRLLHRSPRRLTDRLFTVPVAGAAEAADASAAARAAGPAWRAMPVVERARRISALADFLDAAAADLAREIAIDVGKPLRDAIAEVERTAALLRAAAAAARPGGPARCGPDSEFRRVPLGVVAQVTPWNNPLAIPWGKIGPALAFGNTVVWKPAPAATRLALRTLDVARAAGFPDGVVNLVAGDHRTAAVVMSDPGIDAVSLSGSSSAGWTAQEICARRRIPLQAELGGNNAAIVWEGADLPRAADLVARGAFSFAGQRCTANRRVVVHEKSWPEFLDLVASAAAALRWGDPLDPSTDVGPLVSEDARRRVAAAVDHAAGEAESVIRPHAGKDGGEELRAVGAYFAPTIVAGPPPTSEIVQAETFGPVLVAQRARDFDEALALAGGVRQGLVAALFAGDAAWMRFEGAAKAGILKWNLSTDGADAEAPFGGWKSSGLGPPEHGPGDPEFYGRMQAIYGRAGRRG